MWGVLEEEHKSFPNGREHALGEHLEGRVTPMSGVDDPSKIDLVTFDPARDEYVLVLREPRPWDGSEERARELITKVENYRFFVSSGQLAGNYPDSAGKAVRIQLDCDDVPDPVTAQLLQRIGQVLEEDGLLWHVEIRG